MPVLIFILLASVLSAIATADNPSDCAKALAKIPGITHEEIEPLCEQLKKIPDCKSEKGADILHFERQGTLANPKRILAMSLIHGDELPSGTVSKGWIQRLQKIEPRNSWRVIPIVNPDGLESKTRTNSKGVDLNRNFPTKEWEETALKAWKNQKSDPRRYPGPSAASEAETKCILKHIDEFKPDFIISVHTPIGVLDFDGPPVRVPKSTPLPWTPLGNFPGSLGRYMWKDNQIPVLTIELKGNSSLKKLEEIDLLQDISGSIAIEADRKRGVKK